MKADYGKSGYGILKKLDIIGSYIRTDIVVMKNQ